VTANNTKSSSEFPLLGDEGNLKQFSARALLEKLRLFIIRFGLERTGSAAVSANSSLIRYKRQANGEKMFVMINCSFRVCCINDA